MTIDNVNKAPLLKAFKKLESFKQNLNTEQEQTGAIHAFKYCYELSWKYMQRLLATRGKIANSPREVFRMAALEGFITDPALWFDFIEKMHLTEHCYEQEKADKILNILPAFSQELQKILKVLSL